MPSKTQEYLKLANRTANGITRYWEHWTDFLTTASRLYKYSFTDQLMIYAQRPDATACASFDIWNNRMNRYVRRGSKGIALLDQSSSVPRLHYVFDVSDTGVRRNSRDPEVWQLNDDLFQPVSEMLAREYGIHHERLSQQIADIAGKLAESYWDNNSSDIIGIVDGSFLMDYDDAGQELQFKSAAAISIMYTILERCGFEPEGYFDRDDFQAIYDFSTPDAVYVLGTAVSDCSRDVLRNIERTVKTTIRRRNVERSQHEYEEQERDLLDRRGLPAPEPDLEPAAEAAGQIRQDAPDIPDGTSPGAVQLDAADREAASTSVLQACKSLNAVCEAKQSTQEEMNRLASLLPEYEVVMQMEGTGPITGPALMAEIGDVRRFKNKKALVAFAGIDAPPFQSGNFESKSRHVSKRGSPHLRRAVFLVANIILTLSHKDNSVFCFMDKKRAEGKHYYVYTIAGSAKFLRIYYARVTEYLRTQEIPVAASCLNGNS